MAYTMKQAASLCGVTPRTIMRWESDGKISVSRGENGYRIFTDGDVDILKRLAGPQPNSHIGKLPAKPVQEYYDIGYGEYPKVSARDAIDYLCGSKAWTKGYPQPSDEQLAFRSKMLKR